MPYSHGLLLLKVIDIDFICRHYYANAICIDTVIG